MSGDRERYPSVPERITWTTGFRVPIDKHVLGVLSTFANFKTGKRADMALDTLVARAKIGRRRTLRSLQRLEADEWIVGRRHHRRPTVYDICVEKLAPHWREITLVPESLSDSSVTQNRLAVLSDSGDRLGDSSVTQTGVLSDSSVTPSPVRTDPQADPQIGVVQPQQLTLGPEDVSAPDPGAYDASRVIAELRARLTAPRLVDQRRHG